MLNARFLTVNEVAKLRRCSPVSIRRAIADGRLTAIKPSGKFGPTLIQPSDFDSYMRRGTRFAVGERP